MWPFSLYALDAGQCGPIAVIGRMLTQEGQMAFGKGDRLSTAHEMEASNRTVPLVYGLIYFTNSDLSKGYIAKTDRQLENGPTQMCIDHVVEKIKIADARVKSSQKIFFKSPLLGAYISALENPAQEYVMFQASIGKNAEIGARLHETIVTATANFVNQKENYKGGGTIFFTDAITGGTSKIYHTGDMTYTQFGLKLLAQSSR